MVDTRVLVLVAFALVFMALALVVCGRITEEDRPAVLAFAGCVAALVFCVPAIWLLMCSY